ncbi:MAG: integrase [Alphaproteobacteria bacterium]|nr:MAG: integrase [Alphaproteobacteria bacterium]
MKPFESRKINGLDKPDPCAVSQPRETETQTETHAIASYARKRRDSRPRSGHRHAGPYLMRRGRIFYFRKRLPRCRKNLFLCLSLRTHVPLDAVKRAAALLAVCEKTEPGVLDAMTKKDLAPADARALLMEILRAELARILDRQSDLGAWTDDAIDSRIAELEEENRRLRRAARRENWESVQVLLKRASDLIALPLSEPIEPDLGRQASSLKRRINSVEIDVLDGEEVRTASRPLLAEHGVDDFDGFVRQPVTLTAAFAETRRKYPKKSMQGNINALEKLMLEYFGDIPVTAVTEDRQKAFFAWTARLPRKHGKAHGKNRFTRTARVLTKAEEISQADAADRLATEEIRARTDISLAEKRAILAERLTPRRTLTTIKRDRDGLSRLFRCAAALGVQPPQAISYREIEAHIAAQAPDDTLFVRVTKPKLRMPWTRERLAKFLTCPIYTGCQSRHRRWKRGRLVIRDATYWVPLFVLSTGARIAEVLHLKRTDILFRNGHYCFAIASGPDHPGKTVDARRVIPIPQVLLDLGFVEWFHALPDDHGALLFPEAVRRSTTGDVTSAFGKHLRRILDHLELGDFDEDFYAMRKTFLSMLSSAQVKEGQRQAIAGHKHGTITNVHYTAHETADLKRAVDRADFGLEIQFRRQHGFPVITGCRLANGSALDVEVTLDDAAQAASVVVRDACLSEPVFAFTKRSGLTPADRKAVALRLRRILAERPLNLPKNPLKRAAFEHLQALA